MGNLSPEKQADLLKDKGNQYFKKEKLGAAIEAYTEAITLCPSVPLYWTNRAICERKREQWEKVEADCRRALELDSHCVKAHYLLGLALVHYQQYEEAVKQLEKAMDLGRGAEGNYLVPEIWLELAKAKFAEWEALSEIRQRQQLDLKLHLSQLLREDYVKQLNEAIANMKAASSRTGGLQLPPQEEVADLIRLDSGSRQGSGSIRSRKSWRRVGGVDEVVRYLRIHTDSDLEKLYRSQSEPPSVIQKEAEVASEEQTAFDPLKQHKMSLRRGNSVSIRRQKSEQFSVTTDSSRNPPASPIAAATRGEESQAAPAEPANKRLYPEISPDPAPGLDPNTRPDATPHAASGAPPGAPPARAANESLSSKTESSESSGPPTFDSIYDVFKVFKEFMKLRQNEAGQQLLRVSERYQRQSRVLEEVFQKVEAVDTPVEIPDHLCCKITMDIFRDPVISTSGITYERAAILDHIKKVGAFDPLTRAPLIAAHLVPNLAVKEAVQMYLDEHGWAYGPC